MLDQLDALLARVQAGDSDALEILLSRIRNHLRQIVDRGMDDRVRSRFDPSDVIQDVQVSLFQRIPEYFVGDGISFLAWLEQVVTQRLINLYRENLRAQKRDATREISIETPVGTASNPQALDLLARGLSPSQDAIRAEDRIRVQQALAGLEPVDREIIVLRHFAHLTPNEAAEELGISPAAAAKRYLRALRRLRETVRGWSDLTPPS